MDPAIINRAANRQAAVFAALATAGMIFTILGALAFEHIGGYIPCALCLGQREPYYVAIPIALIALITMWKSAPLVVRRGLMLIVGLLMVYSLVLAVRHSGVEWGWWAGPADCAATAGNITTDAGNLLSQLQTTKAPSCDEAAGRFFGLSFAGWNAIASLIFALAALQSARLMRTP